MGTARERLEAMRAELQRGLRADAATLARDIDERGEDTTPSQHPADVASDLYAREELLAEELTLAAELVEVEDALRRLADGSYGRCVDCGNPIEPARLEVRPQAARCISCRRRADQRGRSPVRA